MVEGRTGWFFDAQTAASLMPVLAHVAVNMPLRAPDIRAHARRFDVSVFRAAVLQVLRAARAGQYGALDAA